jgi:hypothetical protein
MTRKKNETQTSCLAVKLSGQQKAYWVLGQEKELVVGWFLWAV